MKCTENINTNESYDLFKEFWNLGDLPIQGTYISNCMMDITPKYRYTNADNLRRPNKAYYFTANKKKIRVCKAVFKTTLNVSDRMIFTIQRKIRDGGFMLEDMRRRHNNQEKL